MSCLINSAVRWVGLAWIGVVAFGIAPTGNHGALLLQAIAYGVIWLSMLGWAVLDFSPRAARHGSWAFPVVLGVMAAASGAASASSYGLDGGMVIVAFGFVAAMKAGDDIDLAPALGVVVAGILGVEISGLQYSASYGSLLGFPLLIASGLIIGRNRGAIRIQAEQSAALLAQRELLEAEQRRADLLDERTRVAREIHDVLAHSLGALGIQIQAARSVLTDYADIDRAVDLLTTAQRMATEGLTETRRAVHALRNDTLPLAEEIAKATSTYGERYHVAVSLEVDGDPRPVPADATVALLRVVQEALVNAAKHGAGKPVEIRLDYTAAGVRLTIKNELDATSSAGTVSANTGGLSTADAGYGLTGMRERLRILAGTLEAGLEDACWVVTANVPLPPQTPPG